jgi:hypothetical protein
MEQSASKIDIFLSLFKDFDLTVTYRDGHSIPNFEKEALEIERNNVKIKKDLEKALKAAKQETIEVEKRSDDLYRQLISTKENLDILTNEQKILSEELTQKQNELLKSEREKASKERELLELRPLKT